MEFLGPNDYLVIENKGTVQRITNGTQSNEPLLSLDVAENQGLLGISVLKNTTADKLASLATLYSYSSTLLRITKKVFKDKKRMARAISYTDTS